MKQTATQKRLPPKVLAAQLVAEDILTDEEIAQRVGKNRSTIARWKSKNQKFKDMVNKVRASFNELAVTCALATKEGRLRALRQRWLDIEQIKRERGLADDMQSVPGGKTGMILKLYRQIGKESKEIFEYDAALAKEQRLIEDQIAIELGQRVSKMEINAGTFENMTDDELEMYAATGKMPERIKASAPAVH